MTKLHVTEIKTLIRLVVDNIEYRHRSKIQIPLDIIDLNEKLTKLLAEAVMVLPEEKKAP